MMLILADKRMPAPALQQLSKYGKVVPFATEGIVYSSISGHPDIFISQLGQQIIVAPNLPDVYKHELSASGISFLEGELPVGKKYPETTAYNVVFADNKLFHNFRYTDPAITGLMQDADLVHLKQGYTRCSLIALGNENYITSDQGVARSLRQLGLHILYVDPQNILLPDQKHGFIGGCCGIRNKNIFFTGSLKHLKDGSKLVDFCRRCGYSIIELSSGALFDGGSIFFIA